MSYQRIEFVSNGVTLPKTVNRLSVGGGLNSVSSANTLAITLDLTAGGYRRLFTINDLDASGLLSVVHNLGEDFPIVQVYSNLREMLIPDSVMTLDGNNLRVGLGSYGNIAGNWMVVVRK